MNYWQKLEKTVLEVSNAGIFVSTVTTPCFIKNQPGGFLNNSVRLSLTQFNKNCSVDGKIAYKEPCDIILVYFRIKLSLSEF